MTSSSRDRVGSSTSSESDSHSGNSDSMPEGPEFQFDDGKRRGIKRNTKPVFTLSMGPRHRNSAEGGV